MNPYTLIDVQNKMSELLKTTSICLQIESMMKSGKSDDEVMLWVQNEAEALLSRECLEQINQTIIQKE